MQVRRYVAELEISAVLQVLGVSSGRSAQLGSENDFALVIKAVTRLDIDRIGTFERFDVSRIDAGNDFVSGESKHLARVQLTIGDWRLDIGDFDERQQVANLVIGKRRNEAQFVELMKGMFVSIGEDIVYLAGRKEV